VGHQCQKPSGFFDVHGWNAADGHRLLVGQLVSVGARRVWGVRSVVVGVAAG